MRKTKIEREINIFQVNKGLIVEQSPGHQLITYKDDCLSNPQNAKRTEYLLPMPWVRLYLQSNGYGSFYGAKIGLAKQSWMNERESGSLKTYLMPLPCVMPDKRMCGLGAPHNSGDPIRTASELLQMVWGSEFCCHWEAPHTWSSKHGYGFNPFWMNFGVKRPCQYFSHNGDAYRKQDEAIHQVLSQWQDLTLEDIDKFPYSDYNVVADNIHLLEKCEF